MAILIIFFSIKKMIYKKGYIQKKITKFNK